MWPEKKELQLQNTEVFPADCSAMPKYCIAPLCSTRKPRTGNSPALIAWTNPAHWQGQQPLLGVEMRE